MHIAISTSKKMNKLKYEMYNLMVLYILYVLSPFSFELS